MLCAALFSAIAALVTGIPTDVLPNPWFTRMTPVRPLDLIIWPLSSLLIGLLLATYVTPRPARSGWRALLPFSREAPRPGGSSIAGGITTVFAIGCPICNKLVVLVLGLSGALTYFAPIQPLLGALAVLVPLWALRQRIRALTGTCSVELAEPAAAN